MRDEMLQARIRHALDAEMSGLRVSSGQREQILDNAIGGRKVKRKLTFGMALALALTLLAVAALAVTALLSAQEIVEQVAVPAAKDNDLDWRLNTDFSPEELAAFIQACAENGIDLDENSLIMIAFRNGKGYDEEEAIMAVCRVAFGGNIGEWTLAQQHWFWDVMIQIGWAEENDVELPGPDDLTEEDARVRMLAAIRAAYGEDLPLEDKAQYETHIGFVAEGAEDGTVWTLSVEPRGHGWGSYYDACLNRAGEVIEVTHREEAQPEQIEQPVYTLTEAEARHLAAEAIRNETGVADAPLEDETKYRWFIHQRSMGEAVWSVNFISLTVEGGFCSTLVHDATGEVEVTSADVGPVTADNLLARYRAANGWYDGWDTDVWAEVARRAADLPEGETMEGRVTKATPWIAWREGLLTREEAERQAFTRSGVRMGEVNCASLIDAEPNPIWKFRILPYDESYQDSIVVEIDAVTGEMTDLDMYKSDTDLEPGYHMVTLRRIWSRLEYEANGPLYIARLAVLYRFADLSFDMPEVDSLPIFDLRYWVPEVDGNVVRFRSQWLEFPDYEVELDEDHMAVRVEEMESSDAEPVPDALRLEEGGAQDESLYEVDQMAMAAASEAYGVNSLLWPLEAQAEVFAFQLRSVPREGEMTLEQAVAFAREQLPPEGRAYAENAIVGALLYRLDEGTEDEFTRWTIFFMADGNPNDCWRVTFVDKGSDRMTHSLDVKEPGDNSNG